MRKKKISVRPNWKKFVEAVKKFHNAEKGKERVLKQRCLLHCNLRDLEG